MLKCAMAAIAMFELALFVSLVETKRAGMPCSMMEIRLIHPDFYLPSGNLT